MKQEKNYAFWAMEYSILVKQKTQKDIYVLVPFI